MIQPLLPAHPSSALSPSTCSPRAVPSLWSRVTAHPSNVLKFPLRRRSRLGVNRVIFAIDRSLPVFPTKQTCQAPVGTSQRCHNQTHAPQQTASLFDHLVGPREQYRRKVDPRV